MVNIVDGDARHLPFPDASFDIVVSVLCLANIADRTGRADAVSECLRMLRPGGRLVLADYRLTGAYVDILMELGHNSCRSGQLLSVCLGVMRTVAATKIDV